MSIPFSIAINAVPFFDLLEQEERQLAAEIFETEDEREIGTAMDATRRRLAQGVDTFIRTLPASVRNDAETSRGAAYALVGLADERMLHYPAGGLERWRERLLEFELYGSALAGQEIVKQAQLASQGGGTEDTSLLAPLYLAVLREGFEGSLRGDSFGLSTLTASLESVVGAGHEGTLDIASDVGPSRAGWAPGPFALTGIILWLLSGLALWLALSADVLGDASRIAERVESRLPVSVSSTGEIEDPLGRSIGPSEIPTFDEPEEQEDIAPAAAPERRRSTNRTLRGVDESDSSDQP